ncbi:MAG: hypothetical protein IKM04_00875 [Clostridia bacterium]|nr:hypothetical protein [Clostridia bacterium]
MVFDIKKWEEPPKEFRACPMLHVLPKNNRTVLMDAIKSFGFGGVVINPSFENWYDGYEDNIREFAYALNELEERDLSFWLYDENGYPSGAANGETLKGHPELEAKGFYMRRMVAYEPRHVKFALDFESERIIWAAKYPMECPGLHESYVQYDKMIPVPFTDEFCETDLEAKEVFYVFCVKSAYEGSHCTHNVSSFQRYINVMDKRAVRRFIDIMLEPIVKVIPDAFERAEAVFTDEPSLSTFYARGYETWSYALAPWSEDLFELYQKEYGRSILPDLPLLFEGENRGAKVRTDFYRLVGIMIGRAYVEQLSQWCKAHGGVFSGHYFGEEHIAGHVKSYGSFIEVLSKSEYPGLDILQCIPERMEFETVKFPQMAARKSGALRIMAELCPFYDVEEFAKAPLDNMMYVTAVLYMFGVRHCNSYFSSDFRQYDREKLGGYSGYMSCDDANRFNNYLGRMRAMLDGLSNACEVFVYYGLEDSQSKFIPQYSEAWPGRYTEIHENSKRVTNALLNSGYDFYYADRDDIVSAAAETVPSISGNAVKAVIVPAMDFIHNDAYRALEKLKQKGVRVLFLDKLPSSADGGEDPDCFEASRMEDVFSLLAEDASFSVEAGDSCIIKSRFERDGRELWMLANKSRSDSSVKLTHKSKTKAKLYDPESGSITPLELDADIKIPALRGVFIELE